LEEKEREIEEVMEEGAEGVMVEGVKEEEVFRGEPTLPCSRRQS
jgi:hypothetical protein